MMPAIALLLLTEAGPYLPPPIQTRPPKTATAAHPTKTSTAEPSLTELLQVAFEEGVGLSFGLIASPIRFNGVSDKSLSLGASACLAYKTTALRRFPIEVFAGGTTIAAETHSGFAMLIGVAVYKGIGPILAYQFWDAGQWVAPRSSQWILGLTYVLTNEHPHPQ